MRLNDVVSRCGFPQKTLSKRGLRQKNTMAYGSSRVPCTIEIREFETNPTPSWPALFPFSREYFHSRGNDRIASRGCSNCLVAVFSISRQKHQYMPSFSLKDGTSVFELMQLVHLSILSRLLSLSIPLKVTITNNALQTSLAFTS